MEIFKIKSEYIELFKLLKSSGLCDSGGIAKLVISDGLVKVDNIIELRKRYKVKPDSIIEYNNIKLKVEKQ